MKAMKTIKRSEAVRELTCQLLLIFLAVATPFRLLGQNSATSDIRGTVTDASGSVLPEIEVTIIEIQTGVVKHLTTNSSGLYDAVSILPGKYTVTFSKPGFKTEVTSGIILEAGAITVNASLTVGATSETVNVSSEGIRLQTETSEQAATLTEEAMTELPNIRLKWTNFIQSLPGVSGTGTALSINGNMLYEDNWLSDGGTITHPESSDPFIGVQETIAEVKIDTSNFGAQYGAGGVIMNQITKSGTNSFHGAAYEYVENDFFNAKTYFSPKVPNLRFNNWGFSVGGPILKNKLFFYFNRDAIHNTSTSFPFATYPTEAMRKGDFSNPAFQPIYDPATYNGSARQPFAGNIIPASRIDPVAKAIDAYIPLPNLPGGSNNWHGGLTAINPNTRYFGRFDYNITDSNRLTGTVVDTYNVSFTPTPDCPLDCQSNVGHFYQSQLTDVWSFGSKLVNEFRMAYLGQENAFLPPTLGGDYPQKIGLQYAEANIFPNVTINGSAGFGGTSVGSGPNFNLNQNSYEPSDVVTLVRGKHILTFGGTVAMLESNSGLYGNIQSANFTFSGYYSQKAPFTTGGGSGYADFLLGQINTWSANNTPVYYLRTKLPQAFAQDDWKPMPNLTINLGLRYQFQIGWSETENRLGLFDPSLVNPVTGTPGSIWFAGQNGERTHIQNSVNSFLPRVGLSWSPRHDLVIRGGYGRYAYLWSGDVYASNARQVAAGAKGFLSDSRQVSPVFELSDPDPPLNYVSANRNPGAYNGQSLNYYPADTPVAIVNEYSLNVQKQLFDGIIWQVAFVGSYGTNLSFPADVNQVPESLLGPGNAQANRPYPQFNTINGDDYNAHSNYNSLQTYIEKSFHNGLTYNINYSWSKMLDDQDSSGWGGQAGSQDYQNAHVPSVNYGLSNYDSTNRLKGYAVYQLPFGRDRRWLRDKPMLDQLVGGWEASSLVNIQSGTPYNLVVGTSNLSGALSGKWYPNVVGNPHVAHKSAAEWFNPAAFAIPAPYTFGNSGRNSLRGPRYTAVNLSIAKNFRFQIDYPFGLQIRMDAFNAFNHTILANPNGSIGTPSAGTITGTQLTGRLLQLGARFSF